MEIANIEGKTITVCPFCKVVLYVDGDLEALIERTDGHFAESAPCQAEHDRLPTLTDAFAQLRESVSGSTFHAEMVPLPFWKTIFSTPPMFDLDRENHYLWFGWWLITWSAHYIDQLDISISFMPD